MYNSRRHIRIRALIDSGAEHTVFGEQVARQLGINLLDNQRVVLQGVGGEVSGYLAKVDLQLGTIRWTTDAIFSNGIEAGSGLLGQLGFFQFFTVTFLYSRGDITIRQARRQ